MLALCLMLLVTYHALNYAGTISLGLYRYSFSVTPSLKPASYSYAKQKQPGCKKVRGQSEATNISDQKL